MKRIISILIIIFSLLTLVSCNTNKNTKLIIDFGQSNKFSEKDVSDAVQVVINNFDIILSPSILFLGIKRAKSINHKLTEDFASLSFFI